MPGILRYQVFLAYTAAVVAVWYAMIKQGEYSDYGLSPLLVQPFPLWVLLGLALYAASRIIYGVATLGDYPEASTELEGEIKEAKLEMKRRGIQ